MSQIKIVAVLKIKSEYVGELLPVFKGMVEKSRAEEGNVSYDLNQDIQDADQFVFVETWKSAEAIEIHNASTHFQAFVKAIDGKTDKLEIIQMTEVAV